MGTSSDSCPTIAKVTGSGLPAAPASLLPTRAETKPRGDAAGRCQVRLPIRYPWDLGQVTSISEPLFPHLFNGGNKPASQEGCDD